MLVRGLFITFEGGEGCGKSTQAKILAEHLTALNRRVCLTREPGGTPIGEEVRITLKHSAQNHGMTAEAELLLMNASRAQLVREVIRPQLASGAVVICDRFYDSTFAYQAGGRGLDLDVVRAIVDFAVGETRPHLTLLLHTSLEVSAARLASRQSAQPVVRDRFEEAGRAFFERVSTGFQALAAREPQRIKVIDAAAPVSEVTAAILREVAPWLAETAPP